MTTLTFTVKDGFVPVAEVRYLIEAYESLRDEVQGLKHLHQLALNACDAASDRAEAAEADVERLRKLFHLRPEVRAFALLMEQQLRANDHKPGWKNDRPKPLMDRLREEAEELILAILDHGPDQIGKEAADVANFALMVADVCGCLEEKA